MPTPQALCVMAAITRARMLVIHLSPPPLAQPVTQLIIELLSQAAILVLVMPAMLKWGQVCALFV